MKKNIEIYCFIFCSIFTNFVEHDMLDNHTHYCWFLLNLLKKMWSKFMKKYDINSENSSMLNFEKLYTTAVKKAKCTEFEHNLMKTIKEVLLRNWIVEKNYSWEVMQLLYMLMTCSCFVSSWICEKVKIENCSECNYSKSA